MVVLGMAILQSPPVSSSRSTASSSVARIHSAFVDRVEGFRTIGLAHTGPDALDAARTLKPDLILLDLYLSDIFGFDLISQIRVEGADSDVIVISAAARLNEYMSQPRSSRRRTLDHQA